MLIIVVSGGYASFLSGTRGGIDAERAATIQCLHSDTLQCITGEFVSDRGRNDLS
ncbi:hypothetical protein [Paraburkholderia monticola]|jgi:hypothetical protein|uniref:hypothetical protein n=1 Tax=Paraburkholderia monticola TaxID=1399968 RepID=UPI000A50F2C6|nr:hypothetical protein [Paraburkholderia monticola]